MTDHNIAQALYQIAAGRDQVAVRKSELDVDRDRAYEDALNQRAVIQQEGKTQELELRRSHFQRVLESMPVAVIVVDRDGTFSFRNRRFVQLFGYDAADVPDSETWLQRALRWLLRMET